MGWKSHVILDPKLASSKEKLRQLTQVVEGITTTCCTMMETKRKTEAFVHKKFVPANKGKSVVVDKQWASFVYNTKRMYVDTQMAIWLSKLSTRKYDKEGERVGE